MMWLLQMLMKSKAAIALAHEAKLNNMLSVVFSLSAPIRHLCWVMISRVKVKYLFYAATTALIFHLNSNLIAAERQHQHQSSRRHRSFTLCIHKQHSLERESNQKRQQMSTCYWLLNRFASCLTYIVMRWMDVDVPKEIFIIKLNVKGYE